MRTQIIFGVLLFCLAVCLQAPAQPANCILKEPLINIDFGNGSNKSDLNLSSLRQYNKINGNCPDDGNYAFASYALNCFGGHWHNLLPWFVSSRTICCRGSCCHKSRQF